MRNLLKIIFFSFLIFSCEKNPTSNSTSIGQISLTTDKNSYSQLDSVIIILDNTSGLDILLGYRCTCNNLEMYYQKKENNKWSENQWFDYMSLKCMTIIKKINKDKTLKHSILSNEFKTIGIFRLLVPFSIPERDTTIVAISNSFEIK